MGGDREGRQRTSDRLGRTGECIFPGLVWGRGAEEKKQGKRDNGHLAVW